MLTSDLPAITESIDIEGPGADKLAISGNDAHRIFDISGSASVTVSGLTITDGLATSGGGILVEGSAALSISKSRLTDNEALGNADGGGFGGGIEDTSSGALTVTNTTFDTNTAIAVGPNNSNISGYILALGGAIDIAYDSTSLATISKSRFTGNQALGGSPGASGGGGALQQFQQ